MPYLAPAAWDSLGRACELVSPAASMNPLQLSLPIDEFLARSPSPGIPRPRRIFCNRNLRMSNIAWVGFDMDYTLAIYNQQEMDELSIKATIEKLVAARVPGVRPDDPVLDRRSRCAACSSTSGSATSSR